MFVSSCVPYPFSKDDECTFLPTYAERSNPTSEIVLTMQSTQCPADRGCRLPCLETWGCRSGRSWGTAKARAHNRQIHSIMWARVPPGIWLAVQREPGSRIRKRL